MKSQNQARLPWLWERKKAFKNILEELISWRTHGVYLLYKLSETPLETINVCILISHHSLKVPMDKWTRAFTIYSNGHSRSSVTTYRIDSQHGLQPLATQPSPLMGWWTGASKMGQLSSRQTPREHRGLGGQPSLKGVSALAIVDRRGRYQSP